VKNIFLILFGLILTIFLVTFFESVGLMIVAGLAFGTLLSIAYSVHTKA